MKARLIVLFGALTMLCSLAWAQPSQYYLWQNKKSAAKMCEPQAPSADWVKLSGPYEDPNCSIKIKE